MGSETFISKFTQRTLEIIPGLLIWFMLLLPWIGSETFPSFVINLIVVLTLYCFYRAVLVTIGGIIGYINYKNALEIDHLKECRNLKLEELSSIDELPKDLLPKQLIVIANYGEDYPVLKRSIEAIIKQNYPIELIYISVSIEERKAIKDSDYAMRGEYLKRDFGEFLGDRLMFFVHPDGIPGEAVGAAANRTWGTKMAVEELERRGEDINKFLVTAPDGDIVFHREYLASMTYKWLTSEKRNQKFYQTAVYTFNNNYWDVPILIRIISISLTLPILASSVIEKFRRETFSCYTLNLGVMKAVNYWDTSLGIDDTTFYWRPYLHFHGDWHCEVFFIPLSADAVYDPKYTKNHYDQYKQYVRWGWGVISFPIGIRTLYFDAKVSFSEKLIKTLHLLDVFVLSKVISFLLAFGLPILLFFNTSLDRSVASFAAPNTISSILNLTTFLLIPTAILKNLLIPKRPATMSKLKYVTMLILEIPLNLIVLVTFSFVPFIEATTRMMIGQKHVKQIRWSEKSMTQQRK